MSGFACTPNFLNCTLQSWCMKTQLRYIFVCGFDNKLQYQLSILITKVCALTKRSPAMVCNFHCSSQHSKFAVFHFYPTPPLASTTKGCQHNSIWFKLIFILFRLLVAIIDTHDKPQGSSGSIVNTFFYNLGSRSGFQNDHNQIAT